MIVISFVDIVRPFSIYLSQDYHPSFSAPGVAHVTDIITRVIWVLVFPVGYHSIVETIPYSAVSMTVLLEHA